MNSHGKKNNEKKNCLHVNLLRTQDDVFLATAKTESKEIMEPAT